MTPAPRDRLAVTGGAVALAVLNAAGAIVTARLLGVEERGRLVLVLTVAGLAGLLGTAGTSTAYRALRPTGDAALHRCYAALSLLLAGAGGLFALAVLAVWGVLAPEHRVTPALAAAGAGYAAVLALQRQAVDAWIAAGRLLRGSATALAATLAGLLATVVLLPLQPRAVAAVAVLTLGPAVTLLLDWPRLRDDVLGRPALTGGPARRLLGAGARGSGLVVGSALGQRCDRLLLGLLLDPATLAVYAAAHAVAELSRVTTGAAGQLAGRDVAVLGAGDWQARRRALPGLALSVAVLLLVTATAAPMVRLLFGETYAEAARLVPLLAAVELVAMPALVETRLLVARGRLGRASTAVAAGAAVTALSCLLMVPAWSAEGAGVSAALGHVVVTTLVVLTGRPRRRFPTGVSIPALAASPSAAA